MKCHWFSEISPERVELVFRLKNKNYGAYQLRKSYPIIMTKILFSMMVVLIFSSLILRSFFSSPPKAMFENEQVYITEWNIKPLTKEEINTKPKIEKQKLKTKAQTASGQQQNSLRKENASPVIQDTTENQNPTSSPNKHGFKYKFNRPPRRISNRNNFTQRHRS
ncbi:MAG: hypothetical protein N3F09_01615 [Bacteroidia bacterium]|nr:hypothetical protein [Bacteroidia bacterium]